MEFHFTNDGPALDSDAVTARILMIIALVGAAQVSFAQVCGKADPAYIKTASETGGIPMFLDRSEVAKSFHLVRETTRNNISTVFWTTGSLDARAQAIDFPVDSMTRRITFTFSFSAEGNGVTIVSPSRITITEDRSVEVTQLRCGRIVTVVSPEVGTWHVELNGKGTFWAEAEAQSDIYLVNVEFVRRGGRPGHEGFFRIEGQPVAGRPATIRASLSSGKEQTADFFLVSERGELIQKLQMRPLDYSRDGFFGSATLPEVPFRVAVSGLDLNGRPYQRFNSGLFHTESVEVSWNGAFDELSPGETKQAEFTIRNAGPTARTFRFTVADGYRFASKAEPGELTLGPGQSGTIRVDLTVPPGTPAGVGDDVTVVATSTAGPTTSNSCVAHVSVKR